MRRIIKLTLIAGIFLFAPGCKKENSMQLEKKQQVVDPSKIFKVPSTPEEKLLVENLGKVTEILKVLYTDKSNLKVVNAAIFSKVYTDESIMLKDLIYPTNSRLNKVEKFKTLSKRWNISLIKFSNNFWTEINKKDDPSFNLFLNKLNSNASNNTANKEIATVDGTSIYFPYYEGFIPEDGGTFEPIVSIVTAAADADEGWGSLPYYLNGIFQYYIQVLVNDEYAINNPTHIVGLNGIEEVLSPNQPLSPPPPPPPPPGVSRVFVGEGLCKKTMTV